MDLLDINEKTLYFDEPLQPTVYALINQASERYGEQDVEPILLQAYELAPQHLMVLVALYRYYYYQHRLDDALGVSQKVLNISGARLNFPNQWEYLTREHLGAGSLISMGMVRFYLIALKAAAYLKLRMGEWQLAVDMLEKVVELDAADRLGATALLEIAYNVPQTLRYRASS